MVLRHNRRLVATEDIKPGDMYQEGINFGIYRSIKDDTRGLSPFAIGRVNGKIACATLTAGDGIGPEDVAK
jgi:sialic acid synthase SpsE